MRKNEKRGEKVMDYTAVAYFLVFLAAIYPMLVIVLYPFSIVFWLYVILERSQDKIIEDVKKNGHVVIAKYEEQHRMRVKPASGRDISTTYFYEYNGKRYKYNIWTGYFDLPLEMPLYFYKNPKKAARKGSVGVEKMPRIRLLFLTGVLVFVGCVIAMIVFVNCPDMMDSFKVFFEELVLDHP